jgi:hypothetical protein
MESKYSEQYYRVDFDTAKLLKQAGFDSATHSFYNPTYKETNNCLLYPFVGGNIDNWNKEKHLISAPLIAIAKTWCEEKGYKHHALTAYSTNTDWSKNFVCNYTDNREVDIAFISTVCNHLIKTQQ